MVLRKKKRTGTAGESAAGDEVAPPDEPLKKKRKLKKKAAAESSEPAEVAEQTSAAPRKKKKRRVQAPAEEAEEQGAGEAGAASGAAEGAEEEATEETQPAMSRGIKKRLKAKAKKTAAAEEPAQEEEEEAAKEDAEDHTVFIDGLPYAWEVSKINEIFARCGEVLDVRAPKWQDSGRLRGYGHVSFASAEAKEEALKMNGIKVGAKGRFLKIEAAKKPDEGNKTSAKDLEGKRRLFVKNLPYEATEEDLRKLFGKFGKIIDVRIPMSFGRSKGFAYVEFAKPETLKNAVTAGAELHDRKLVLDADAGQGPKAGFHYSAGAFEGRGGGRGKAFGKGKDGGKGKGKGKKGEGRGGGRGRGTMSLF